MKCDLILAMTCCDRMEYTAKTLESLSKCYGVKDIKLHIFCEPIDQDVINYISSLAFCDIHVHVNSERFGHTKNSHLSLNYCFDKYKDYVVLIEDDQLFSIDFLKIHLYFRDEYRDDSNIFTAAAGHYINARGQPKRVEHDYTYTKHKWFSNQGWGTWMDRWVAVRDNWEEYELIQGDNYIIRYKNNGWDHKMNAVHRGDRCQVIPYLSRVYNIGSQGIHCFDELWRDKIQLKNWAGDRDIQLDEDYVYKNICIEDGACPVPKGHGKEGLYV